ncbi:MAG: hypothetical protein R6U31_04365, partial [bacterium]
MFHRKIILTILIPAVFIAAACSTPALETIIEESGFEARDICFRKNYGLNDTFDSPLSDSILNNPYLLYNNYEGIVDSLKGIDIDSSHYSDADDIFALIEQLSADIEDIMRSSINTEFEQNRKIVSAAPLMFFEDSLHYMYRDALERNINAEGIGSETDPDSILTYLSNSSAGFDEIRSLRESFIMRIEQLIAEGLIRPIDTMLSSGRLIVSSSGNDVYEEDYDFIIDLGGNDTYINQCGVVYPYTRRFKFIIDLFGDDSYVSTDSFSVSLGSVNGVTFIEDYSGNDRYYLHNFSLASGFIGFSSVRDRSGDDVYSSGFFSQGAGFYG